VRDEGKDFPRFHKETDGPPAETWGFLALGFEVLGGQLPCRMILGADFSCDVWRKRLANGSESVNQGLDTAESHRHVGTSGQGQDPPPSRANPPLEMRKYAPGHEVFVQSILRRVSIVTSWEGGHAV